MKRFFYVITLALLALFAWHFKDSSQVQALLSQPTSSHSSKPGFTAFANDGASKSAFGVHKCKRGASVIYTDAPCLKDQEERAMTGGAVTIVKGQRPSMAPPSLPASMPNARTLLSDPNEPSLMDKQIERATR